MPGNPAGAGAQAGAGLLPGWAPALITTVFSGCTLSITSITGWVRTELDELYFIRGAQVQQRFDPGSAGG